ncbi:MAG: hypothetical protein FJ222_10050 [Lentisphaerae bacterium]|nr:hypothetical protein [Lentisphaerota bacterium]
MSTNEIARYFELRKRIFEIEAQLEAMKPAVADQLRRQNGVARLDGYDLILSTFTAWNYSPRIEALQQSLNEAKRGERQNGTASVREKRDMLVLKAHRDADQVREEEATYGEWESGDGTRPVQHGSPL